MGMDFKYIMINTGHGMNPIIFGQHQQHIDVWNAFKQGNAKVVGAGFISKNWTCYGKSVSLGIKARTEDTQIIQQMMGGE